MASRKESVASNHGIEIWSSTILYAQDRIVQVGLEGRIEMFKANVFLLDSSRGQKYDRIYLGACAPPSLKRRLYDLLEVGGVLVGPFSLKRGSQVLRKVTRRSRMVGACLTVIVVSLGAQGSVLCLLGLGFRV